jgi:hypothetical protein
MRKRLRQALWQDKSLDNQSRDLREIFANIRDEEIRPFVGLYQASMSLSVDSKPIAIELLRVVNPAAPDAPVTHGTAVGFKIKQSGNERTAQITRIDQMTPGTTKYEFTFRITYGDD